MPSQLTLVEADRDVQTPLRTEKMALHSSSYTSFHSSHLLDSFSSFIFVFEFSTGTTSSSRRSKTSAMAAKGTGLVDISWVFTGCEQQDTNRN